MMTYQVKDGDGRVWTICKQPCGWVAYASNSLVLDPVPTLREAKSLVRSLKNVQVI
jgi:hypothetical protein